MVLSPRLLPFCNRFSSRTAGGKKIFAALLHFEDRCAIILKSSEIRGMRL
jgi:hypothetical protein